MYVYYLHIKEPILFYAVNVRFKLAKNLYLMLFSVLCYLQVGQKFYIQGANLNFRSDIAYIKMIFAATTEAVTQNSKPDVRLRSVTTYKQTHQTQSTKESTSHYSLCAEDRNRA